MKAKIGDKVRSKETINSALRKGEIYCVMDSHDGRLLRVQHPKEGLVEGLWSQNRFELLPKFDIGDMVRCLDPVFPALGTGLDYKVVRLCDDKQVEVEGVSGYWDASRFELVVPELAEGHPHAAGMAEYAKDALTNKEPWKLWEYSAGNPANWRPCMASPHWDTVNQYRRKPAVTTVRVNGFDVPAPVQTALQKCITYYLAAPSSEVWYYEYGFATPVLRALQKRGVVHTTKEGAIAHAKALLYVNPEGR